LGVIPPPQEIVKRENPNNKEQLTKTETDFLDVMDKTCFIEETSLFVND
jgi:hypothetical protein